MAMRFTPTSLGDDIHPLPSPASPSTTSLIERNASFTGGLDIEQYCHILHEAALPMLATTEVFSIFGDGTGLIAYLDFLLALTSFRSDAAHTTSANSLEDMARLYFDIFDVDGSGIITFDELISVMGKLLDRIDPDLVAVRLTSAEIYGFFDKESKGEISFGEFFDLFNAITRQ